MSTSPNARIDPEAAMDAELIRVEAGGCSGPRRSSRGPAVLVVVEGTGSALAGDVWIEVGPGDLVRVDAGEPCALRSASSGVMLGVLVRPRESGEESGSRAA